MTRSQVSKASAQSHTSPARAVTKAAKSRKRDAVRLKGHGKLRGTVAVFEDGEELELDAEKLALYLYFLRERNRISERRAAGDPRPWTTDIILHSYRFAEIYRLMDRGSQDINTQVISEGDQSLEECVFRAILYRTFARTSTWDYLRATFGIPTWRNFDRTRYLEALDSRVASGVPLYTSAYQIPAPTAQQIGGNSSHDRSLRLVDLMMRTSLPQRLLELPELCDQYHLVQQYPSMGPFLALRCAFSVWT